MEQKKKKRAGSAPAAAKRTAAQKPAGRKNVRKKKPAAQAGLPLWAARLKDRLAALPGRFVKLFDSWFYRIYFPLVALAVVGILIGCHYLRGFAADYEAAQPVHVADQVGQRFLDADYDGLYDLDTSAQAVSGGDRAFYVQSLRDVTAGGVIEWSEGIASGTDELQYVVTLNGSRFATFTLVPSGETTAHGNALWRLGTVTTHVALKEEEPVVAPDQAPCRIQAPAGYAVTVDGRPLTDADAIRTGIAMYLDGFLPSGETAPTLTEYGFTPENTPPAIAVADPEGREAQVREDSENIWYCAPRADEEIRRRFEEDIVRLAQRVAKYTTADLSSSALMADVVDDSPAEATLKAFKNDWAPSHKSERFENVAVTDFCVLSDACITCRVTFDYILTSRRENDYPYETAYTLCLLRKGDEIRLYNLMFH